MVVFLQKEKGISGDFYHQVEADLQKLDITQEDVELKNKESLKEIVKKVVEICILLSECLDFFNGVNNC